MLKLELPLAFLSYVMPNNQRTSDPNLQACSLASKWVWLVLAYGDWSSPGCSLKAVAIKVLLRRMTPTIAIHSFSKEEILLVLESLEAFHDRCKVGNFVAFGEYVCCSDGNKLAMALTVVTA